MTGLICKDLVLIKRSMGSTILILAFLVVLFSTMMGIAAGMAMIPIVFAMMILSTFILDDSTKWDAFALSTPMAKRRMVLSKYCTSMVLILMGATFSVIVAGIALMLRGNVWSLEVTFTLLASVGVACCMNAFLLPLAYRFGAERARVVLMILIFVPICFAALMKEQFPTVSMSDTEAGLIFVNLSLLGILLFFPSYFISKAIYMRKEF